MVFETKRLILRPWTEEDAEKLYIIAKDPEVGPKTGWPVHESVEHSRTVIENVLSHPGNYAVISKATGELMGDVGVKYKGVSEVVRNDKEIEFGCWLGSAYWGNGYIPEALECLQSFLITVKGIRGFWYGFYEGNSKSKRVAEKLGFEYSHVIRGHYVKLLDMKTDAYYWFADRKSVIDKLLKKAEANGVAVFSKDTKIQGDIMRKQDSVLTDMYDHNYFFTEGTPDNNIFEIAEQYQKEHGFDFVKIRTEKKLKAPKGFERSEDLRMMLEYGAERNWQTNDELVIKKLSEEDISEDLINLELENWVKILGEDFCRRKMQRYITACQEKQGYDFYAAYLNGKIVGSLHTYCDFNCLIIDGLFTDEDFRHKKIATTLLKAAASSFKGIVFLHADADDTPKNMYKAMCFDVVGSNYWYFKKL